MIEGLFVAIDAYNASRIEQGRAAELFACSAVIAKHRLRQVIASDRETVPAWRWVNRGRWVDREIPCGFSPGLLALGFDSPMLWRQWFKPHFRWERRK